MRNFVEPWIPQRADPYVTNEHGGKYYFTASVPEYDRIVLRCADTLEELSKAEEKTIWTKHDRGEMSYHVWAPELHYLFGAWYIYFASSNVDDIWRLRPYVLKCLGDDPMNDEWIELGMMQRADSDRFSFEAFSLDGTVFEVNDTWYYVWAEKVGAADMISNLYIAKMESGNKLATEQVLLSTPDYAWERYGFWVNEGPSAVIHDEKIYLTYSASDTSPAYCVGLLVADINSDLLDPGCWRKQRNPLLKSDVEINLYGPGHNSFTKNEDGEDVMVFHTRTTDKLISDNPLYDPNRHAVIGKVIWEDDTMNIEI